MKKDKSEQIAVALESLRWLGTKIVESHIMLEHLTKEISNRPDMPEEAIEDLLNEEMIANEELKNRLAFEIENMKKLGILPKNKDYGRH
jgi:hypothetical protein